MILPGLGNDGGGNFLGFDTARTIATLTSAGQIVTGDFTGRGEVDIAAVEQGGVEIVYGTPPNIAANATSHTARDLGTVLHYVSQPQAIVTGHEDSYFTLTVPTESAPEARVVRYDRLPRALVQRRSGAGLQMQVLDASGNVVLGSGSRFRVVADQGQQLLVHVFGVSLRPARWRKVPALTRSISPCCRRW